MTSNLDRFKGHAIIRCSISRKRYKMQSHVNGILIGTYRPYYTVGGAYIFEWCCVIWVTAKFSLTRSIGGLCDSESWASCLFMNGNFPMPSHLCTLEVVHSRVGHGLDSSMDWIGSICGRNCLESEIFRLEAGLVWSNKLWLYFSFFSVCSFLRLLVHVRYCITMAVWLLFIVGYLINCTY